MNGYSNVWGGFNQHLLDQSGLCIAVETAALQMFMVVFARVGFESCGTTHQYYACILGLVLRGLGCLLRMHGCRVAGLYGLSTAWLRPVAWLQGCGVCVAAGMQGLQDGMATSSRPGAGLQGCRVMWSGPSAGLQACRVVG